MAKSDSCLKKTIASQHCSTYFMSNALLEFRINIQSLGMLGDYLAGGREGKSRSLLPPFHSSSLCFCSVFSFPHRQRRGEVARLFSRWIRQIFQPTCLNVVKFEVRALHLWAFQEKNMPLQYSVVLTINHQSTCHWNRKPTPIIEMTFKQSMFSATWYFWKILPWNTLFQKRKKYFFHNRLWVPGL